MTLTYPVGNLGSIASLFIADKSVFLSCAIDTIYIIYQL